MPRLEAGASHGAATMSLGPKHHVSRLDSVQLQEIKTAYVNAE